MASADGDGDKKPTTKTIAAYDDDGCDGKSRESEAKAKATSAATTPTTLTMAHGIYVSERASDKSAAFYRVQHERYVVWLWLSI